MEGDRVFTRDELECMISSPLIPWDRQIMYGLEGLAGLRHGEAAGLRWRNYDAVAQPLGPAHPVRGVPPGSAWFRGWVQRSEHIEGHMGWTSRRSWEHNGNRQGSHLEDH